MTTTLTTREIQAILKGRLPDPFKVLGMHEKSVKGKKMLVVRAFCPDAAHIWVYDPLKKKGYPMERVHADGIFEAPIPRRRKPFHYQFEIQDSYGKTRQICDAYSCEPVLADEDLTLFHAGRHYNIYEHLGCHPRTLNDISGAVFAVWAPHAQAVAVIGDFNHWDGRRNPMRFRENAGVWELFVPDVKPGDRYKYAITSQTGDVLKKTDPVGFHFEFRPHTASIVADLEQFEWTDEDWMLARKHRDPLKQPISVYEVHLGSWKRKKTEGKNPFLSYRQLTTQLIPYVKNMGFTHIELMPVTEHPFDGSWGYQTTGYYAPTSRHGTPDEFMAFVNACHREGIGVLIDWVPSHFPKDPHALAKFDGTCLYEYADPRMGEHQDWGTLIFDYSKDEVRNFLLANAMFWFETFHIDGMRVDAVSSMLYLDYSRNDGEWIPNKYGGRENLDALHFLKEANTMLHERFPGTMMIAEESTSWLGVTYPTYLGGLEFAFKWNLGWMNDMLHYMSHDPVYRKFVHNIVSFVLLYAFHERFMLVLSHDEVVHGKGSLVNKMPGDEWQKFANLRLLYGFMYGHPGKQLLFMGDEFGQIREWNHDSGLEWDLLQYPLHQGLQRFVRDLNHLYVSEPALYADDAQDRCFEWIDCHDYEQSTFSFLRRTLGEYQQTVIVICNFTPVHRKQHRVGVPFPGVYHEIMNSDDEIYGGSHVVNRGGCHAESASYQGQPYSCTLSLPPLGIVILKPMGEEAESPSLKTDWDVVMPGNRERKKLATPAADAGRKERHQTQTHTQWATGVPRVSVAGGPGIKRLLEARNIDATEALWNDEEEEPEGDRRDAEAGSIMSKRYRNSQSAKPQGSKAAITGKKNEATYQKSGE